MESKQIYIITRIPFFLPVAESVGHEWFVEGPIVAQGGIILCISIFLTWIREGKTSILILVVPVSEPRIFQIQHFHSE